MDPSHFWLTIYTRLTGQARVLSGVPNSQRARDQRPECQAYRAPVRTARVHQSEEKTPLDYRLANHIRIGSRRLSRISFNSRLRSCVVTRWGANPEIQCDEIERIRSSSALALAHAHLKCFQCAKNQRTKKGREAPKTPGSRNYLIFRGVPMCAGEVWLECN
jgi:hypothetical protein